MKNRQGIKVKTKQEIMVRKKPGMMLKRQIGDNGKNETRNKERKGKGN